MLEDAAHVVHGVKIVAVTACGDLLIVLPTAAHKKPQMRARDEIALGDQPVVGIHHGIDAHAVGVGKLPNRRQLGARAQRALIDQMAKTIHDLLDQGHGRGGIKHEHDKSKRGGWLQHHPRVIAKRVCLYCTHRLHSTCQKGHKLYMLARQTRQ